MTCPACNAVIPETSKFCPECGAVLNQRAGAARAQGEELRQVTVIFSDLSGYTAMSERLPAEEVKQITSRIFREAAAIARKYDGRLDRLDCPDGQRNFDDVYPLAAILAAASTIISIMGFLKLGRRILERAKKEIRDQSYLTESAYFEADAQISCFDGIWDSPHLIHFREPGSLKGEFQVITMYLAFCGLIDIERCDLSRAVERIDQLRYVAEVFENIDARICHQELKTKYLLKVGRAAEAVAEAARGLAAAREAGQRPMCIYFLGMKAMALSMLGNLDESELVLRETERLVKKEGMVFAHFKTRYAIARLNFEVLRLESIPSGRQAKKVAKAARTALACSKKWIGDRTEALRLMGTLYWLRGKRQKALRRWRESMQVGERIGAKLERARTWREVGKRLLESDSGVRSLNGTSAEDYLARARSFFGEKELLWDLQACCR